MENPVKTNIESIGGMQIGNSCLCGYIKWIIESIPRAPSKIIGTIEWWTVGWYYRIISNRAPVMARGESRNGVTRDLRPIHPDDDNETVLQYRAWNATGPKVSQLNMGTKLSQWMRITMYMQYRKDWFGCSGYWWRNRRSTRKIHLGCT